MKTNHNNLFGKQIILSAMDAAWHLKTSICESILCSENSKPVDKNIFGRQLAFSTASDISFSLGFASTGLRAGTILCSDEIITNLQSIEQAVRLHIPLVIFAETETQNFVSMLSKSGAVVFSATTSQESLDLLINAYRIAELSLIPVVVCIDEAISKAEQHVLFPDRSVISHFAGNTDNFISSPTASQQIIFGKNRKIIPFWFNHDNPLSIGASKQLKESAIETAAKQEYFYNHLDEIINKSFEDFHKDTGRKYNDIELYNIRNADYLMISYGLISQNVNDAIDKFCLSHKVKIAAARLIQISPLPAKSIQSILVAKKAVTVLEQAAPAINNPDIFKEISCLHETKQLKVFSGNYGSLPRLETLLEVIGNMLPDGKEKSKFWMDINFTKPDSNFPKHQVLLQAIEREYPDAQNKIIKSQIPDIKTQVSSQYNQIIPQIIRRYKDKGPAYTKLSRFYDDTASFFMTEPEELVADPFQAIPVMPPSTANFNLANRRTEGQLLPAFYSGSCTGCGDCFLHCPHSAINPLSTGIENMIKAGINIATANGAKITQLIPLVKNLAKNIHEIIKENKENINSVSDFIPPAFENIALQMKLEGEKLMSAKQDIETVTAALANLPVSVTDVFPGEIFTLAIDINSCTGCSVCAEVCKDDALKMKEQNPDLISMHNARYALWEQMPDTSADTITRLLDEKKYNPFSAILLSRYFNLAFNGTSNNSDGDSIKSMVHLIAAISEALIQPKVKEAIKTIDEFISGLSQNIHKQLGAALPSQDFEALSKVLSAIKEERKPFEEVIKMFGTGGHLKLVDTKSLKRKVDLTKSLRTLKWLLSEGYTGTGRARVGFMVDSSLNCSNSYPWNNFTSPVLIQHGGISFELAKGIVQGHIRQILDNIKLLRRAELELAGKYEPEINDIQIASITWNDLTDMEKGLVAPMVIIVNRNKLAGNDFGQLLGMLESNLPVKAIVFDDAVPEIDNAVADIIGGIGALLPALSLQNAQIIKSSLAMPEHLFTGLSQAFNNHKPVLVWIFVPNISKHLISYKSFPKLHSLSLHSRAFPIFNFYPDRAGIFLSSKIDIESNPQSSEIWMQSDLAYKENGEAKTLPYSLTWADWAYTLKLWREEFILHDDLMGKPVSVSEFISLSKSERTGKSPVIFRIDHDAALKKYKVSDEVIAATQACAKAWHVLREISGELSPREFGAEKLHKKTEAALSEKYEKKMSEAKKEFENKIANLEQDYLEKIRVKLKEKLVILSK